MAKEGWPEQVDIDWALKHGWSWNGCDFFPSHMVKVVPNPRSDKPGWCVWLAPIGAAQTDAPFHNLRAALRCAEQVRRNRLFGTDEMRCDDD